MKTSESIAKLTAAMVAVQSDEAFKSIGKDKKAKVPTKTGGGYEYGYADLATCYEAIVPLLAKHGVAIWQPTSSRGTDVIVTTILAHAGEWIAEEFTVPAGDRGAQALGSAATYAKRYALLGMCSIASTDEDDDGKTAHESARAQRSAPKKPAPPPRAAKPREPGEDDEDTLVDEAMELLAHVAGCMAEDELKAQRPAIVDLRKRLLSAGKQAYADRLTVAVKERYESITGKPAIPAVGGAV